MPEPTYSELLKKWRELHDPNRTPCNPVGLCAKCGRPEPYTYHVPACQWVRIVPVELQTSIVCGACFDGMARKALAEVGNNVLSCQHLSKEPPMSTDPRSNMPAIPLEEGVPVTQGSDCGIVVIVIRGELKPGGEGCGVYWARYGYDGRLLTDSYTLRADLTKPAGFGYALRFYIGKVLGIHKANSIARWSANHLGGRTTDADRAQLTAALAEVM